MMGPKMLRIKGDLTAPFSSSGNDNIKLTGRLQTGGFKMRNLFASQRKRILKSTNMKRSDQRRMIGQITDAAEAHAADIEKSANMYSYLIGGSVAKKNTTTAGANSNRQG